MMLKNCQGGINDVKELSRGEFSPGAVPCQSWDLMTRDESLDSASPPLVRIHNHDDHQYCDDHGDQHEDDGNVETLTSHCKNTESDTYRVVFLTAPPPKKKISVPVPPISQPQLLFQKIL